ncbi:S-layer homology domain-containing protein [Paenibacillus sp. GSMTC-2017]|uniref:S-layer homology domain-containing protein n=1 Tax=Paenibacillus sp. GSMTC-2017 TaxID=2794350 RepID=UPI0018D84CDF|nr:S-layer homology domain-containing protein [Paenibacillus sp. GSMTC-2017]MBH5317432.1 S-layer homology domain-containing protein [Paenibacillus sp. GSMTC-2017]
MNKKMIATVLTLLLIFTNASIVSALSPVAEVYYNTGSSTYDSSAFESKLNEAIKAKLNEAGVNPKYVSIMDASADPTTVTDMTYVHTGRDSWYMGATPEVETADYNHVQMTNNGKTFTFYGYTRPGYKDFMLTDGSPSGKKVITFEMDESKVNYHSMEGGGFLFNTMIDSEEKLSGYAILYVNNAVNVYKINGVNVKNLHNEQMNGLSGITGVSLVKSYSKGTATKHSIKINATDSKLNMWDNGEQIIKDLALPNVYGNEFGPIVSHVGHGCSIISIFSYDNMKLFSTSSKTLDEAAVAIPWDTNSPLRYVVDINEDPLKSLDGGTNQETLTNSLNTSGAQYVGVTDSVYKTTSDTFIEGITNGGVHINSNESEETIIEAIAERVANQIIADYKNAILAIEKAEDKTTITFKSGDSKTAVKNNIALVQDPDVTTVWSSDQPSIIAPDGTVTRPDIDQKGTYVTLKATMTKDGLTSEKTFTVYVLAAQPGPLTNLSVTPGNSQATLKFPPLKGTLDGDIIVEQSTNGTDFKPVNPVESLTASSTSATVTGLTNGETYHFRLTVKSGFYTGVSNKVTATPSEPVTTLSVVAGDQQATLNFPVLTGATKIVVEQSTDGITFTPATITGELNAASTNVTVTGLTNGTTYQIRLNVESGKHAGVSNIVTATPSEPVTTLSAVAGDQQATLNFPALTGATDIVVEKSIDGITFTPATTSGELNAASTSVIVTGLTNGTTYHIRLNVESGKHAGVSNVVTATPFKPVTTLSAVEGDTVVTLNFPALTGATNIVVEQSTDSINFTPATISGELNDASTSVSVSGLTNGTTYFIRLNVESGKHAGLSNIVTVIPNEPPAPEAQKPTMDTKVIVSDPLNGGKVVEEKITKLIGDNLKVSGKIVSTDGKVLDLPSIVMNANGTFTLPKVATGEYTLSMNIIAPNGEKLAGPAGKLVVDNNGKASLTVDLVDPYGTILDTITEQPVAGVKMQLYWADTELNRSKGKVPGTLVNLPVLPDFAPNQNHNPQISSASGEYGWMVYADGDYYFLGEKDGYVVFDSRNDKREEKFGSDSFIKDGIIHVGQTIVKFSFSAQPKVKATGDHKPFMVGYPDGSFLPDRGISRSEVAAILSRLYTSEASSNQVAYSDVNAKNWAQEAITIAARNKWMVGFGDDMFKPKKQITRAEFAQILANVYKWDVVKESTYTDVAGHWAANAIATVQKQGLLFDFTEKTFDPNKPITRVEVVRIFNKLHDRKPWHIDIEQKWTDVPTGHEFYKDIMEASIEHPFEQFETGIETWKK